MGKLMSKAGLIQAIAGEHSDMLTRKDVKDILESLATVMTAAAATNTIVKIDDLIGLPKAVTVSNTPK